MSLDIIKGPLGLEDREGRYGFNAEEWRKIRLQGVALAKVMYRGNEDLTKAVAMARGLAVALGIRARCGPQEWTEEDGERARKAKWEREGDFLRAAQAAGAWWLAGRRAEWVDGVLERSSRITE